VIRRGLFASLSLAIVVVLVPWLLSGGLAGILTGRGDLPRVWPRLPDSVSLLGLELHGPGVQLVGVPVAVLAWLLNGPASLFAAIWTGVPALRGVIVVGFLLATALVTMRVRARNRRRYVRYDVEPYRTDLAEPDAVIDLMESLHKRLLVRYWRRVLYGQPSVGLEIHHTCERGSTVRVARLAVTCPEESAASVRSAITGCYPNSGLVVAGQRTVGTGYVLRLKKRYAFIRRMKVLGDRRGPEKPAMDRILTALGDAGASAMVQIALTPTPASFDRLSRWLYQESETDGVPRDGLGEIVPRRDRSRVHEQELEGGLAIQHRALFFTDVRIMARSRRTCERIAAELRAQGAENGLVERGTTVRHWLLGLYRRRVERGEGNPLPGTRRGVFASTELATLWHLPSLGYARVPFRRSNVPFLPAPPDVVRPTDSQGLGRDAYGPVTVALDALEQNTKIVATVKQGKTSILVAGFTEDLTHGGCVILLDAKGDAAEAALSSVPLERTVTYFDLARPMLGFNPLWVPGVEPDVIADYVVESMRNLFDEGDIRASSDRYLRNAIIAVKHHEGDVATLWDVHKILSVGPQGKEYRREVGEHLAHLTEVKEISEFFRTELTTQLEEATSTTTAKLDAPSNKLARFINSASMKRILLHADEILDFDRIIRGGEVLIVRGALGSIGIGNTSVTMQLLLGMFDAALSRQQDMVAEADRVPVRLNVDEAPVVFNRGMAQTLALKRSAGLTTRAAWQTNSQWTDPDVRAILDALFGHHIWGNTASAQDARDAIEVMMPEHSDTLRLGDPTRAKSSATADLILHLPRYHFLVSLTSGNGRLPSFILRSDPLRPDPEIIERHLRQQWERVGRPFGYDDWRSSTTATLLGSVSSPTRPVPPSAASPDATAARPAPDASRSAPADDAPPAEPTPSNNDAAPGADEATAGAAHQPDDPPVLPPADAEATSGESSGESPASTRTTPDSFLELAQLDMTVGIKRAPEVEIASDLELAILTGLAQAPDRTMTRQQVRASWFGKRTAEEAAQLLAPMLKRGWLRELSVADPAGGGAIDGYAIGREGTRAVATARLAARKLDDADLEVLAWLAEVRYAFGTQIGRRWFADVTPATVRRRLKRLSDAGLVERFQFKFHDGGGSPACYSITSSGITLAKTTVGPKGNYLDPVRKLDAPVSDDPAGRQPRHDVHVSGWLIAAEQALGVPFANVRGPQSAFVLPPQRRVRNEWVTLGPDDLQPAGDGGVFLHSFRTRTADGGQQPVEHFRAVKPDAAVEVRLARSNAPRRELLVEVDLTERPSKNLSKWERYDHFLTGWAAHLDRYGKHLGAPIVVFVCVSDEQALQFVSAADGTVVARRARAGEPAETWDYPARDNLLFVAEEAAHNGSLAGYRLPAFPPDVREQLAASTRTARTSARTCQPRATSLTDLLAAPRRV
jgi:DNA-binding transcriptional ArsR family regulator